MGGLAPGHTSPLGTGTVLPFYLSELNLGPTLFSSSIALSYS